MPRRASASSASSFAYPDASALLFAEDSGRFLVSIRSEDRERFERSMARLPCALLGEATAEHRIRASLGGKLLFNSPLGEIERAYKTPIA
jgi:phosphoribosylformylglycinamidine (FGAM) synthase-like enzyme